MDKVVDNLKNDKELNVELIKEYSKTVFFESLTTKTEGCNGEILFRDNFAKNFTVTEFLKFFKKRKTYTDRKQKVVIKIDPSKINFSKNISNNIDDFLTTDNVENNKKIDVSFGKSTLFIVTVDNKNFKFKLFNGCKFQIVGKNVCPYIYRIILTFISAFSRQYKKVVIDENNYVRMQKTTQIVMTKLFKFNFYIDLKLLFEALIYQKKIKFFDISHGNGGLVLRLYNKDRMYPITFQKQQVTINKFYTDQDKELHEIFEMIFDVFISYLQYLKWVDYNIFKV